MLHHATVLAAALSCGRAITRVTTVEAETYPGTIRDKSNEKGGEEEDRSINTWRISLLGGKIHRCVSFTVICSAITGHEFHVGRIFNKWRFVLVDMTVRERTECVANNGNSLCELLTAR